MGREPSVTVLPPDWKRAAANALWPHLRRAITTGEWPSVTTDYRRYADVPTRHGGGHATAAGFPKQLPKYEPVQTGGRIIARIDAERWPGGITLGAYLWRDAFELAETLTPPDALIELHHALLHSTARAPFILDKNRHGTPKLRRHNDPRALITLGVARALELTASLATVEVITPELENALLGDDDTHGITPSVTFAVAQRSGYANEGENHA